MYTALKHLHVLCVGITLALFWLRGHWMLTDSPRLKSRWVRSVPHINDSVLLAAGIGLLIVAWGNPLQQPWLMAKIVGLLAYIGLGTLALKRGKTKPIRLTAFVAALVVFGYILAVAVSKQVLPWS